MSVQPAVPDACRPPSDDRAIRTVLVVDDSRAQRFVVASGLRTWGYKVLQAASGEEALDLCARVEIDLVVSDWIMPGMNGIDFCRELRCRQRQRYVYFILLTSNADKSAVAQGLDVGADDFLVKPVDTGELRARIRAGERVLEMERELRANNALLTRTLAELRQLYDSLDRDLVEARGLQQSLLRERSRTFGAGRVSLLLRQCGHVGGDMVGAFEINPGLAGLYAFDVSGHGVTSALLTARLAGMLSGEGGEHNIAVTRGPDGPVGRDPSAVAAAMNRLMLSEIQTDRYATLVYAEIALADGRVRMVQAGHPHPVIQHADGGVSVLGAGGLPIGLIDGAAYEGVEARLRPGDRLLMVSDGVTECLDPAGRQFGQEGLTSALGRLAALNGNDLLDGLMWELARWAGTEDFADDISCALFEYGVAPGT